MEYTIKLTGEDLGVIWKALGNLPYSQVAPLVWRLQEQINEQDKPKQEEITE